MATAREQADTMLVADLTWPEVRDVLARGCRIAVVPMGACEQHGPHLPMGTDTYIITEICRRGAQLAAEQEGAPVALVFPPIWYGDGETRVPGEVWLRPSTIIALLVDIIEQIEHHGFRQIVIASGHGWNPWIIIESLREARWRGARAELFQLSPGAFGAAAVKEVRETRNTGHACEIETSKGLYLFGERVHLDRVVGGREEPIFWKEPSPYGAVMRSEVYQQGVSAAWVGEHPGYAGDPTKASAAKGERIITAQAAGFATFLRELHSGGTRRNHA